MTRWSHKTEAVWPHEPDPHYNGNGLPAYWTCHAKVGKERCDVELLLDGKRVPITVEIRKGAEQVESKMSEQP